MILRILRPRDKKQMTVIDCHQTSIRNEFCENTAVDDRHNWIIGSRYDKRGLSHEA